MDTTPPRSGELAIHPARPPATHDGFQWVDRTKDVNDALERIGNEAGLSFPPRGEMESPSKRTRSPRHDVKHSFSLLFYLDRDLLKTALQHFFDWLSVIEKHEDEKLTVLLTQLQRALERLPPRTGSARTTRLPQELLAPMSPTMSIKHAPRIPVEASGEIDLPQLANEDGHTSNNTSFAVSVWSKPSQASPDPGSPATEFESPYAPQQSPGNAMFGSSWSGVTATKVIQADRAEYTSSSKKRARDPSPFSPASVQRRLNFTPKESRRGVDDTANGFTTQEYPASSGLQAAMIRLDELAQPNPTNHIPDEHVRVQRIPNDGLSRTDFPPCFLHLRMYLRFEIQRFLQVSGLSPDVLKAEWTPPWTLESLYRYANGSGRSFKSGFENGFEENSDLSAELRWSKNDSSAEPLFRLALAAPKRDLSNSMQRKFGRHRFLQIDLPSLSSVPKHLGLGGQSVHIKRRVYELLGDEQRLLGCRWRLFLVRPIKKKNPRDVDFRKAGGVHLHFFATSSASATDNLEPTSVVDLLDWAVPLRENSYQTSCKIYARLDLAASRTTAAFQFTREEISYNEQDITATDLPSDLYFNDPTLDFTEPYDEKVVMSDGQCWISPWAMEKIRDTAGLHYLPAVVQGRLFGAKGIWYLRSGNPVPIEKPKDPLIGVSRSQIKAVQKEHTSSEAYDPLSLTFNSASFSQQVKPSVLYSDFLPVLVDRGISRDRLKRFVQRMADMEVKDLLDAFQSRTALLRWIHSQNASREDSNRLNQTEMNEFPLALEERVKYMLQSHFEPCENRYLWQEAFTLAKRILEDKKKHFRVPLPRSAMVLGMADPYGCLGPDEIHMNFSAMFEDSETKQRWAHLHNLAALVARNPTLRASDIQKVRVVYRPELAHLPDVVVFSSKGKRPLASKLQGGDYDGDTFWVCWQPELVEGFQNAPAPLSLPRPEACGISVDRRKLSAALGLDIEHAPLDEAKVIRWNVDQAINRIQGSWLGIATRAHEAAVYHGNSLRTPQVHALADLHDHLVDADKQGFRFDGEAWKDFRSKHNIMILPDPAYRRLLNDSDEDGVESGDRPKPRESNIVDYMYFSVVEKTFDNGLRKAQNSFGIVPTLDPSLTGIYDSMLSDATESAFIRNELELLQSKLSVMAEAWRSWSNMAKAPKQRNAPKSRLAWEEKFREIRAEFLAISPDDSTHPVAKEWLRRTGNAPSMWTFLKVSTLAKLHHSSKRMLWNVAGDELCRLKARVSGATRELDMEAYLELKPISRKRVLPKAMDEDDEFDDDYYEALFDDVIVI